MFGVGDIAYEEDFCNFARDVDGWVSRMSGKKMIELACGDVSSGEIEDDFEQWIAQLFFLIKPPVADATPAAAAAPPPAPIVIEEVRHTAHRRPSVSDWMPGGGRGGAKARAVLRTARRRRRGEWSACTEHSSSPRG